MIYYTFLVRFQGVLQNQNGCFEKKMRGPISTKFGQNIARSFVHPNFKNSEDNLLHFQTTVAQSLVLTPVKIGEG